jgi:hypothetical protein
LIHRRPRVFNRHSARTAQLEEKSQGDIFASIGAKQTDSKKALPDFGQRRSRPTTGSP